MKRSVLTTLSAAAFVLPLGLAACNVESTENNTINGGGSGGTGAKAGSAGTAGAAGSAAGSAGSAGAAAGSAGSAGAAAGSAGSAGAAAGSAGAAGAAAGSAGSAGAAAGSAGAAGATAGSAGSAGAAAGSAGSAGAAAGSGGAGGDAGGAGGAAGGAAGTAGSAGAGGSGPAPDAHIRFAHLFISPNPLANVAIDLCIQDASESSWTGYKPFFFDNNSAGKFTFTRVSVLAALESGAKRIRPVLGTAQNCDTALPTVPDILVTIPANAIGTFAIMGTASPSAAFFPDTIEAGATKVSINGIHANGAVSAPVIFGLGDEPNDRFVDEDVAQFKAISMDNNLVPTAGKNGIFLVSDITAANTLAQFNDTDVHAAGDRYNVFFTAPSSIGAKNNLIVCGVATPEQELTITPDPALGDAISTLCTVQAN